jgi:hypothetical protein
MSHHGDADPRSGSHGVAVGNGVVERPARFKTSRCEYRRRSSGASKDLKTTHDTGHVQPPFLTGTDP